MCPTILRLHLAERNGCGKGIAGVAPVEVIDNQNVAGLGDTEAVHQMRSDKTGAARYENFHLLQYIPEELSGSST